MTEVNYDHLLDGEDEVDYEEYDISNEREEALLEEDDEEFPKTRKYGVSKTQPESDNDEPEDVLSLDVEEDFQDEDKQYDDEPPKKKTQKFPVEKPAAQDTDQMVLDSTTQAARKTFGMKKGTIQNRQNKNYNRGFTRNDRFRRGGGRGAFQSKNQFPKNTRGRNNTILINPRFEGVVPVSENKPRLAWDNSQYNQNNLAQQQWVANPTVGGVNPLLVSNLVNGLANLVQPQNNFMPQSFFDRSSNSYEAPLSFEPPPRILENMVQQGYSQDPRPLLHSDPPYQHYHSQEPTQFNSYPNYGNGYNQPLNSTHEPRRNYYPLENSNDRPQSYNSYPQFPSKNSQFSNSPYPNQNYSDYSTNNFEQRNYNHRNEGPNYRNNAQNSGVYSRGKQENNYNNKNRNVLQQRNNRNLESVRVQPAVFEHRNENWKQERVWETKNSNLRNVRDITPTDSVAEGVLDMKNKREEPVAEVKDVSAPVEEKVEVDGRALAEDEDEEMRSYRLKIEEQKREREKLLRIKEERRKQMMQQRQQQEEVMLPPVAPPKPQQQNAPQPQQQFQRNQQQHQPKIQLFSKQFRENQQRLQNSYQQPPPEFYPVPEQNPYYPYDQNQSVDNSFDPFEPDLTNFTFRISNDIQSRPPPIVKELPRVETSGFLSNRVVVVKGKDANPNGNRTSANIDLTSLNVGQGGVNQQISSNVGGVSSFFNSRRVLKKDGDLLNTQLVVLNNLSASVNQEKIMKLAEDVGEIQNLEVDKQQRRATILFKSVASAHTFFKKNQRRMLDLSVIEVQLKPMP